MEKLEKTRVSLQILIKSSIATICLLVLILTLISSSWRHFKFSPTNPQFVSSGWLRVVRVSVQARKAYVQRISPLYVVDSDHVRSNLNTMMLCSSGPCQILTNLYVLFANSSRISVYIVLRNITQRFRNYTLALFGWAPLDPYVEVLTFISANFVVLLIFDEKLLGGSERLRWRLTYRSTTSGWGF